MTTENDAMVQADRKSPCGCRKGRADGACPPSSADTRSPHGGVDCGYRGSSENDRRAGARSELLPYRHAYEVLPELAASLHWLLLVGGRLIATFLPATQGEP